MTAIPPMPKVFDTVDFDRSSTLKGMLSSFGIQEHLDNKDNTEVIINRPYELWTESSEGWKCFEMPRLSYKNLMAFAIAFAAYNKLELKKDTPICSGVLPDGQRGQVAIPSAVERDTVSIVIRQPSMNRFSFDDYVGSGRLNDWHDVSVFKTQNTLLPASQVEAAMREADEIKYLNEYLGIPDDVQLQLFELQMLKAKADRNIKEFIRLAVEHKQNLCLIGATGSGKTTFTKAICDLVPHETRIVTIEDTHELDLPKHGNRVHMFYKDVTPKELLKACMRMKPDRIFLTELRGDEAYDYLNALNTGHGGSVTTVHANDCNSAYYRIGTLIKQSEIGSKIEFDQIMRDVYTTIDVMIFLKYTKVTEIAYDPVRKARLLQGKSL